MFAFISMHQNDRQRHSYVALCLVSERAVLHRLAVNPKLNKVVLYLDNDDTGQTVSLRIAEHLKNSGYAYVLIHQPQGKDWDEDLINLYEWMAMA